VPSPASAASTPGRARRYAPLWLRLLRLNVVRFIAVGTIGLTADAALFSLASYQGLEDAFARALSLGAATALTWRLNRRFTFGESARRKTFEGSCYTAVALCAQGLNYAAFLALRASVPEMPALVALFCGAAIAAGFSYTGQRFFTFRGRIRA
jgi:putative flippase GtrA